jgi:hypothetical protein
VQIAANVLKALILPGARKQNECCGVDSSAQGLVEEELGECGLLAEACYGSLSVLVLSVMGMNDLPRGKGLLHPLLEEEIRWRDDDGDDGELQVRDRCQLYGLLQVSMRSSPRVKRLPLTD